MLLRNTGLLLRWSRFSSAKNVPNVVKPAPVKAPKLLPGELESFRFRRENDYIYAGFSEEELYGVKIGIKHSPAMRAEMIKY